MKTQTDYLKRYLDGPIRKDIHKKMVFLTGPRQTGKTRLAKHLLEVAGVAGAGRYLNWDVGEERRLMIREEFPAGEGPLVLDEIHKYSRWRQVVKGLFDKRGSELEILVTGSARLDVFRRGGDSLQGRYFLYRLLPFSLAEIGGGSQDDLEHLLTYGGFPEPFLAASEKETRRWSRDYQSRIISEDLRDLEHVKDISLLETLALRLPDLVGSPLSVNALREDLQVAHATVARWLMALERIYAIFRICSFGAPRIRAVKKESKHYHYDWTLINEPGIRFENLVACHLLKWCYYREDVEGQKMELRFFRDTDGREVDFVIMENGKPAKFIECKLSATEVAPSLRYLKQRFDFAEAIQLVLRTDTDVITRDGIRVCPARKFLAGLV